MPIRIFEEPAFAVTGEFAPVEDQLIAPLGCLPFKQGPSGIAADAAVHELNTVPLTSDELIHLEARVVVVHVVQFRIFRQLNPGSSTVPMTIQALRVEIDTDPKTLGYATLRAQSNGPEAVAAKLNELGASAETLFKQYVPLEDVLAAIVKTEFDALTSAQKTVVDQFVRGTRIKSGDPNMRSTLQALFAAGTTTRTNLTNLASRSASRAEALWDEGTSVSAQQVAEALAL